MNIKVIKEKIGYSAILSDFGIFTQGDNFEELTINLKEAIELYYEKNMKLKKGVTFNEFKEFDLVLN
ncbi:MAG: type II toxin-antitoxin system HicB family antitoxin [Candidatus Gracilibacteria bacterium]|nr:type II toxin-antitoxin system HicB family antitoxin [Candidatus Gracilibacteria bacterium]